MDNSSKIICRKCNGNHLTIKCGKTETSKIENVETYKKDEPERKKYEGRQEHSNYKRNDTDNTDFKRTINKVKIGSLPTDMTQEELAELLSDWGNVRNIRVLNYPESSTAYVEFRSADEVDYLVKALDKTPFDHYIITVEKLDS